MSVLRNPWFLIIGVFLVVANLQGCGGGGGGGGSPASGPTNQSPEDAVRALVADWLKTGGPDLILAQTDTASSTASSSHPLGFMRFRDFFSEEEWLLQVDQIVYLSADQADIYTSYFYQNLAVGQSTIIFHMFRDQGFWALADLEVTSLPAAVVTATGIQGYVTDRITHQPVSGALVGLWSGPSQVASTSTGLDGFYRFLDLTPGRYTIVVSHKGYTIQTISDILVN